MRCLCCNKELQLDEHYYHKRCLRALFGSEEMPLIDVEQIKNHLEEEAEALLKKKSLIPGVQEKLSLGLSNKNDRLTVNDYPKGYIIKPETIRFKSIARAEHLVMSMANDVGIATPMHALIKMDDEHYIYIIKRMDRINNKKIHMEDMCQLSNKTTEYKYDGSYEQVGKLIYKYTKRSVADLVEYFYRLLFNFITCNSDMHLKNFSLIEDDEVHLSMAYDLLPVNIIYPKDTEQTALTLNGKKRNISKKDFLELAKSLQIDEKVVHSLFNKIYSYKDILIENINNSLLDDNAKYLFKKELTRRIELFK